MAGKGSPPGVRQGGRKPGTPNKLTKEVKEMILEALEGAGGVQYLVTQAHASPSAFLSLVGKVLPLQLTGDKNNPVAIEGIGLIPVAPKHDAKH